jgi:O-acetylhomoserine (thiol)-lyase
MQRHVENARRVATFLAGHPAVGWVSYPPSNHPLVEKYVPAGPGAVFTFGVKGGYPAGKQFIEKVELASHLANVGDAKTLVIHPASTTHQQVPANERSMAGVGDDMIRISVGLEDIEDILADLDRALGGGG